MSRITAKTKMLLDAAAEAFDLRTVQETCVVAGVIDCDAAASIRPWFRLEEEPRRAEPGVLRSYGQSDNIRDDRKSFPSCAAASTENLSSIVLPINTPRFYR